MTPAKAPAAYICQNGHCLLGSRLDQGRFTGGISAQQVSLLTGDSVPVVEEHGEYGEGYCPNCGEHGKEES